jgi:hypothetical protein
VFLYQTVLLYCISVFCDVQWQENVYVNPLEIPGFLHKLVIKFDTTIDKHSLLKLITQKQLYVFVSLLNTPYKHSQSRVGKYVNPWI